MAKINITKLNIGSKKNLQPEKVESIWLFLNKDINLFQGINIKTKEFFYHELFMLLIAGVDLKAALDLIVAEQQKEYEKKVFEDIRQSILEGDSLSCALEKHKSFTP